MGVEYLKKGQPTQNIVMRLCLDSQITLAVFSKVVVKIEKAISDKKAQNKAVLICCHMLPGRTDVELFSMFKTSLP